MTKEKLAQLRFLREEIEIFRKMLRELQAEAESCGLSFNGMPRSPGISDKVSMYAVKIHDLQKLIDLKMQERIAEQARLERYIQSVKNSQIRVILTLRYINGLSFQQIAFRIGNYDESVPRKRLEKFFRCSEMSESDMVE